MRVEELLVHHRVERLEVALDHRAEAFVLKVEELLLAHCQISFAVMEDALAFVDSRSYYWPIGRTILDRNVLSRGESRVVIGDTSIIAAPTSRVPGRHVRRVRRPVDAGTKEPVVVVDVDVMCLHHPHQMHRIGAAGKAAVSVVDGVADRLCGGEALRADSDRAGAMLRLRHAMRHRPGFLAAG